MRQVQPSLRSGGRHVPRPLVRQPRNAHSPGEDPGNLSGHLIKGARYRHAQGVTSLLFSGDGESRAKSKLAREGEG